MAKPKCRWSYPQQWSDWSEHLAAVLDPRLRWRLPILLAGILFVQGRRTVTTWLRAADISDDFADYYYFLVPVGRKSKAIATGRKRGQGRKRGHCTFWEAAGC